jgi:hypothetical protein
LVGEHSGAGAMQLLALVHCTQLWLGPHTGVGAMQLVLLRQPTHACVDVLQ